MNGVVFLFGFVDLEDARGYVWDGYVLVDNDVQVGLVVH